MVIVDEEKKEKLSLWKKLQASCPGKMCQVAWGFDFFEFLSGGYSNLSMLIQNFKKWSWKFTLYLVKKKKIEWVKICRWEKKKEIELRDINCLI